MIAAVNQFIGAYAERLRDRGRLVADAGTAYAEADDNAATTIRDAAM